MIQISAFMVRIPLRSSLLQFRHLQKVSKLLQLKGTPKCLMTTLKLLTLKSLLTSKTLTTPHLVTMIPWLKTRITLIHYKTSQGSPMIIRTCNSLSL